jgi:hypothetical protein
VGALRALASDREALVSPSPAASHLSPEEKNAVVSALTLSHDRSKDALVDLVEFNRQRRALFQGTLPVSNGAAFFKSEDDDQFALPQQVSESP